MMSTFQHDDLDDDEHDNPVSYGLSRGLGEFIGTVLRLTPALVMLRVRMTEVQPPHLAQLDSVKYSSQLDVSWL